MHTCSHDKQGGIWQLRHKQKGKASPDVYMAQCVFVYSQGRTDHNNCCTMARKVDQLEACGERCLAEAVQVFTV